MKPHEETLRARTVGAMGSIVVRDVNGNEHIVASVDSDGHARFFAAAPDMARTLLEVRDAMLTKTLDEEGAVEVMERALRKAGVLP